MCLQRAKINLSGTSTAAHRVTGVTNSDEEQAAEGGWASKQSATLAAGQSTSMEMGDVMTT
jgi:hypothetical protein